MDLLKLEKSAILIPTPGQTEQEYLAAHLKKNNWFYTVSQEKINLKKDFVKRQNFTLPKQSFSQSLLEKTLTKFLSLQ